MSCRSIVWARGPSNHFSQDPAGEGILASLGHIGRETMRRLTPEELKSRLRLDFQVFQRMQGTIFTGEAYRSKVDLDGRRNPITSVDQGHLATKYRVDFHVKTLIGPG